MRTYYTSFPILLLLITFSFALSTTNTILSFHNQEPVQHTFSSFQDACQFDISSYQTLKLSPQEKDLLNSSLASQNVTQLDIVNLNLDLELNPERNDMMMSFDHEAGAKGFSYISCILIVASVVSVLKTIYIHFIQREPYVEEEKCIQDSNLFTSQPGFEDVSMTQSSKFPVNIFILDNVKQVYKNIPKNAILIYA
jgi:hypothetical protein